MYWLRYNDRWRAFRVWFASHFGKRWMWIESGPGWLKYGGWVTSPKGAYVFDGVEYIFVGERKR